MPTQLIGLCKYMSTGQPPMVLVSYKTHLVLGSNLNYAGMALRKISQYAGALTGIVGFTTTV